MKEKVIEFLGNQPKAGSERFNKALELYRKSKNSNESQVRFFNSLGYSPERLKNLMYELQKLHGITDLEVAKARQSNSVEEKEVEAPEQLPVTPAAKGNTVASADGENQNQDLQIVEAKDKIVDLPENATAEEVIEKVENAPAVEPSLPSEDATADQKDPEVVVLNVKDVGGLSEELKQKLSDFDVEASSYNDMKSFAADFSDATGLNAADQKKASLKAFITEAKKKFTES